MIEILKIEHTIDIFKKHVIIKVNKKEQKTTKQKEVIR